MVLGATVGPAGAATSPGYRLVPAVAVSAAKTVIVNDTLWKCTPDGCIAGQATSRPAVVCAQAARNVGKLTSFSALGKEFDADALAKCNEKAK
jgi:hypothetical protein